MLEALKAHLDSRQVSRIVYGTIIGLAVVVALRSHPPKPGSVIAALLGTAVAVALAEVYSDYLGTETRTHRRVEREDARHIWKEAGAVAFGIAFPAVFFVLAAAGAMETLTAFRAAQWTGLGLIAFYGYCAARLRGDGPLVGLLHAALVTLVGGFVIALHAFTH
jgi:hypothetical protein